jgi:large repetitive protein
MLLMQRFLLRSVFFITLFVSTIYSYSQDQRRQNWWFGNTARGIQFSRPGDTARLVTRPAAAVTGYGSAGGAVASDPASGQLLFYTDGNVVYDATHRPMPNGTGLLGNPSGNSPAAIVAIPNQPNRYYILTNDASPLTAGTIRVTQVDLTLPGNNVLTAGSPPLGDVTGVKAVAVANLDNEAEAMIIIPHTNGTDFWLITNEFNTTNFNVSTITSAGITGAATPTEPLVTDISGQPVPGGTGVTFRATQFAYHTGTTNLAVAVADPSKNAMVFDFNPTNGELRFNVNTGFVFNSAAPATSPLPAIYDVEWSASGDFLYVSRQNASGGGDVLQFDRATTNVLVTPVNVLPAAVARSYGLQMAPDSAIYHLYQAVAGGPFLVGRITLTDSAAADVVYEPLPLGSVNFNATQFPQFLAKAPIVITIDFDVAGLCANAPTTFFPEVAPGADSLVWDFGDGGRSSDWSPTYTYSAGQTYPVRVRAYLAGDSAVYTENVTITQFDLQIQLVQDTTACSCELKFPKADPPPPPCNAFTLTATATGATGAIQWYGPSGALAGQNSLTLSSVDSAGFYYVIVQDPAGSGCVAYAGVNIREYGVEDPRSNIWHFGNQAGINFNDDFRPTTGADAITGPLSSAEGTAVVCDQNGQVIFSTNGEQVFDRAGNPSPLLPSPPGLGGSQNSTQSALIVPVPGDPTLYYIFVTQQIYPTTIPGYELRYAIFDRKLGANGQLKDLDGDGDPTTNPSAVLFTKSTERLTGNQNWVIAHEYGNNNFRAYRLTPTGISSPVISNIGSDHSLAIAENGQGYMKLGPSNTLAVALSTPGISNVVEIFDFVDSTGAVINFRQVDLQQAAGQVYGIEFSPSGTKLYASTIGAGSSLHEFAYDSATSTYLKKPLIPVVPASPEIGAIQTGPDGTIYVATNGAAALGTIDPNENRDQPSTFNQSDFALVGGTTSTLGLPNFIQNINDALQTPTISATGVCFGSPTIFQGSGTDPIDTLTWFFGDGSSVAGANLTQVEHTYSAPGTYIVTLQLSNRCVGLLSPNLTDTVTISPIPNALSGVVALCNGGSDERMVSIAPAEATPDLTYLWSHGDTTRDPIPPNDDQPYFVEVTNGAGCVGTGRWDVFDNRPQVDLGPDRTVCQGSPQFIVMDAGNPGTLYQWFYQRTAVAAPTGTAQTFRHNTDLLSPPLHEYIVLVTDTFTTCVMRDTIALTVNSEVLATYTQMDPTSCTSANGEVTIDVLTTGTYIYALTVGPTTSRQGDFVGPGTIGPITGLNGGAYNLRVTDQVTGCFFQETVGLDEPQVFGDPILDPEDCNIPFSDPPLLPTNLTFDVTSFPAPTDYVFDIYNTSTFERASGDETTGNPVANLRNADFYVEVTDVNDCSLVTGPWSIRPLPDVEFDYTLSECTDPFIDIVTPSTDILWTEAGTTIVGQETNPRIEPNFASGTNGLFDYTLHIGGTPTVTCPVDTVFTLNISIDNPADIEQTDACQNMVTLSASPTGDYVYRWERDGVDFAGGQQIAVTTADNGVEFKVELRNTTTNCVIESLPEEVAVLGLLDVEIINDQPCEGEEFELVARANQFPDTFIWEYNGSVVSGEADSVLTISDEREGTFKVTVQRSTATFSCVDSDEVEITIAPVTQGVLTDAGVICPEDPNTDPETTKALVVLDPGPGFISYNWFTETGGVRSSLNHTEQTYTADETGTFSVDLVNSFGCTATDQITLEEECDPKITGPNAFRPAGLNKEFFLFSFFVADSPFEIYIFNRWGEMIFHSNDRNFRWNGGIDNQAGREVPPGTYSYLVKYQSSYRPQDGIQEYRGGVVVLK